MVRRSSIALWSCIALVSWRPHCGHSDSPSGVTRERLDQGLHHDECHVRGPVDAPEAPLKRNVLNSVLFPPSSRLSLLLERIEPRLTADRTVRLTDDELAVLVWLLTDVEPIARVALQCDNLVHRHY